VAAAPPITVAAGAGAEPFHGAAMLRFPVRSAR